MRITGKQKRAIEKVTGKAWDSFPERTITDYLAYTDRGVPCETNELIEAHRHHAVTVEMWREDFRRGLLFLTDFEGCPDAYREHAHQIYEQEMGLIPSCNK